METSFNKYYGKFVEFLNRVNGKSGNSKRINELEKEVEDLTGKLVCKERRITEYNQFLEMVVHDLRSPISTAYSFIDILKEEKLGEPSEVHNFYKIIEKSLRKSLDTTQLVDFAGMDLNELKKKSSPQNVEDSAEELYMLKEKELKKAGIGLNLDCKVEKIKMPTPLFSCLISNTLGDGFNYSSSDVNFSSYEEGDSIVLQVSNLKEDRNINRGLYGQGAGKGGTFVRHIVQNLYEGNVKTKDEGDFYSKKIYLPRKHVEF